jgi:hypothetical protein
MFSLTYGIGVSAGVFGKVQGPVGRFNEFCWALTSNGNHGAKAKAGHDTIKLNRKTGNPPPSGFHKVR